ncbi:PA2778 family cysteine peptidase [Ideonella azotifigens]|uniref:PA2778 family cysteine peptidase n=2 Tax=Ideonella azotifigens TaxID=513160 RepID=A0ABN1KLW1_9BURK
MSHAQGRRRLLHALAAPCIASLAGCTSLTPPMTAALQAQAPAGLPPRVELAGVPFFADDSTLCGPATLAGVLQAAGFAATPAELAPQVYLPAREGSLQPEMLAAAARHGALATRMAPELLALLRELAAGTPVLVLVNLALPFWPRWHYAVLVGYDLGRGELRLHSGMDGHASWPMATFEHTWARSGHWAMAVTPPSRLPATAELPASREAVLALQRVQGAAASLPAWRAAAARWPQDLVLGMGLGNSLYARGDKAEAASQFEALAARLDSAAAWNNLAQVRWELGQPEAARQAAQQAWRRAEQAEPAWADAVGQTLRQVNP